MRFRLATRTASRFRAFSWWRSDEHCGADIARPFHALVCGARLVAACASTATARPRPRGTLGAADRPDRRRQDAGRILAHPGGVERDLAARSEGVVQPYLHR